MKDIDQPSEKLKEAMREILAICKKRQIGAHVILADQTHGEYELYFPEWSKAQLERRPQGIRFKAKGKDEDQTIAATVHMIQVILEASGNVYAGMAKLINELTKWITIEGGPKRV